MYLCDAYKKKLELFTIMINMIYIVCDTKNITFPSCPKWQFFDSDCQIIKQKSSVCVTLGFQAQSKAFQRTV